LGALGGAQRRRCLGDDRQGAVRTPEPALAVGLDGSVSVDAREPADRPQLAQRLGVAPGGEGGERRGLADDVDTPSTAHGRLGVLVGLLRVVLEQPSRHDEVLRDALGVRLRQGAQPRPCCPVELCGLHALGDLRLRGPVGTGRTRLRAVAVVTSPPTIAEAASAAGAVVTGAVVAGAVVPAGTAVAAGTPTARPVLATGTAAAPVPVASPPVVTTPSPPGPTIGAPTAPAGTLRLGAALTAAIAATGLLVAWTGVPGAVGAGAARTLAASWPVAALPVSPATGPVLAVRARPLPRARRPPTGRPATSGPLAGAASPGSVVTAAPLRAAATAGVVALGRRARRVVLLGFRRHVCTPRSAARSRRHDSLDIQQGPPRNGAALVERMSGGDLLSPAVSHAVPSALRGLASGVGMDPGVSPSLWPP